MFGGIKVKPAPKSAPRILPASSRFRFVHRFVDNWYRDPYGWELTKSILFFATSVCAIKLVCDLEIIPSDVAESSASM